MGLRPIVGTGKRPPAINARVETAATSKFFRDIWQTGRAIVPADGWYEWKKDAANPKIKQPYYITLRSGEPMFSLRSGGFSEAPRWNPETATALLSLRHLALPACSIFTIGVLWFYRQSTLRSGCSRSFCRSRLRS